MEKTRNYKRENCQGKVRRTILNNDSFGITLNGVHAFEWTIDVLNKKTNAIKSYIYPNRIAALKAISMIKRQYAY